MNTPICPHCRQEMKIYQEKLTHKTWWCHCRQEPTWYNEHLIQPLAVKVTGKRDAG